MTQISRPWNGTVTGDAGPYSDSDWQTIWKNIIGWGGIRSNSGVFLMSGTQPADGLKVQAQSPVSASVNVLRGVALVQGIVYINSATEALAIAANGSGNPRIDTIILRADYALQTVRLAVLQGAAAASPSAPALTQSAGVMWEIPLADVAVANGFTTLADTAITSRHEWVNAPPAVYLDSITNNSGAERNTGDLVVWDSTADRAATTTTVRDAKGVLGVWSGRTAIAGSGRVLVRGIGYVKADAAVTRGDLLTTSTTAGSATSPIANGAAANAVVGRALETTSGAGLVLAYIHPRVARDYDVAQFQDQKTTNTGGGSTVATTWTKRTLNTEVQDTGNFASVSSDVLTLLAGTYTIYFTTTFGAAVARARLRNTSDGTTLIQTVNIANSVASGYVNFTITASKNIELQYYANGIVANGLGTALNTGEVEVYSDVFIVRHGETT